MGRPLKKRIITVLFIHPQTGGSHLITKQKGSRRYECQGQGTTVFTLVPTTSLSPGQAYMLAFDVHGNTYFVTKLTRHLATVVQKEKVGVPAFQFASNTRVEWRDFAAAIDGVSVTIENDY